MKSADLVDYITDALREGKSFRYITFELVNAGWNNTDIQEAISQIQKPSSVATYRAPTAEETRKPLTPVVGTPVSNPLPSLVEEARPLVLKKKPTEGAIPSSRVFTSFLQKEMEKQKIPTEVGTAALSDIPLVDVSVPALQEKQIQKIEDRSVEDVPTTESVIESVPVEVPSVGEVMATPVLIPLPPQEEPVVEEASPVADESIQKEIPIASEEPVVIPEEPVPVAGPVPQEPVAEPIKEAEKALYQSPALRPDGYFIPTLGYLADEINSGIQNNPEALADQIGKPKFVVPTKVVITVWRREEGAPK